MTCIIGIGCEGDVVMAHYRGGFLGMGIKPDDKWSMPLCFKHHTEQHNYQKGERAWWIEMFNTFPQVLDGIMRMAGERRYELWQE